ncbi:MAG TPA: DUF4245 domain-containing protein [Mycobacteriales bacterium]|nr:DUF4245 domain-containing protein [Mycobacteriales bacterium]
MTETGVVSGDPAVGSAPARSKRLSGTAVDMVRSLGLLLVIIAVTLVFVPGLLHPSKSQRVRPVAFADDVQGFRQVTGLAAVTPRGLGSGWYANSAALTYRRTVAHLRIGWVTPTKDYAALHEGNGPAATFVRTVLGSRGLTSIATVNVGGDRWTESKSDAGELSLSRTAGRITIVITGSASLAQQRQLAAAVSA